MQDPLTEAIADAISAILALTGIIWAVRVLNLLLLVAAITWIVKKVWKYGNEDRKPKQYKKQKQYNQWTDDWMQNATARQNNQYEYTDPVKPGKTKKLRNNTWTTDGWYYDEYLKTWVGPDYQPEWEYNPKTRMWVDSNQLNKDRYGKANEQVRQKWENLKREEAQLEALRAPVYLTDEEKELAKRIHIDRKEPSYEEWKAAREKERQEQK